MSQNLHKYSLILLCGLFLWLLAACSGAAPSAPVVQTAVDPAVGLEGTLSSTPTATSVGAEAAPTLVPATATTEPTPRPTLDADVTVRIDLTQPGYPISPLIYGMTGAPVEMLQDLRLPLRSWGGNPNSRYNWKLGNAWNAARDYFYTNGNYGYTGKSADNDFIRENVQAGAATRLTVPTLGWVAKDTSSCSFPQPDGTCGMADYVMCDKPGQTADPHQTSVEAPPEFIGEWMDELNASGLAVDYIAMDNEPELWGATHYDVHPTCTSYDEILQKYVDYAKVVKAKVPQAKIMGPVSCCWYYYWDSMLGKADRLAHGNKEFLPWFLQQMAAYEQENGVRLLDILDIHYYPEAVYNDDASASVAAMRLRETNSLWDPKYKDESWIKKPIYLIPRMKELIAKDYPGTKLAISEWNYGAAGSMNGALAIADVLGIFGREQLDMAAYYRYPEANSPGYFAFKMYTNYDGKGGRFGDTSVPVTSSEPENISVYAAQDSATGRVMLMLINKNPDKGYSLQVLGDGVPAMKAANLYRFDQSDLTGIRVEAVDPNLPLGLDLPAYSLSLLVLEAAN